VQSVGGARNQSKPLVQCRKLKKAGGAGNTKEGRRGRAIKTGRRGRAIKVRPVGAGN